MHNSAGIGQSLLSLLLFFGVSFIIFLIGRGITLWYFKINNIIGLQESILKELKKFNSSNVADQITDTVPADPTYNVDTSAKGDAFCLGCREVAPQNELYKKSDCDEFYHKKCLPKTD